MASKKITYLFGAGASYNAVPILNSLPLNMRNVAEDLKKKPAIGNIKVYEDYPIPSDKIIEFASHLIELSEKSEEFGTIDTYAKMLWLNNDNHELQRLKFSLSIFFSLWHGYYHSKFILKEAKENKWHEYYQHIDPRYKTLVSNYLEKNESGQIFLNQDVNFISWNYDYQLESAFNFFINNHNLLESEKPLIPFLPLKPTSKNRIIHLNGISNFISSETSSFLFAEKDFENRKTILKRLDHILALEEIDFRDILIKYSWDESNSLIDQAKKTMIKTDILVIVGYSFPTFNRAVDSQLLSGDDNIFDKIIYQDPKSNVEVLEYFHFNFTEQETDESGRNKAFKIVKNSDQFYIPPEFFPKGKLYNRFTDYNF
ncbi:MAG: hypothetical protein WBG46_06695 [Nonlabens sp.]